MRRAVDVTLALALPRACIVCGRAMAIEERGLVCGVCWSRIPQLPKPWCHRCGHPIEAGENSCPLCALLDSRCATARSVCWVPHANSSPLLAALKYQGWWGVSDGMADRMLRVGADVLRGVEAPLLIPIPLAPSRLRERGYNQCGHLARALVRRGSGMACAEVLIRVRTTVSQTQLTPAERRANVHGAFAVPARARAAVRGRACILVDDVLTTGATLNACAVALSDGGASEIRYWTFGRARSIADRP